MADDWVPMRVNLAADPKVIMMADYLIRDQHFKSGIFDPLGVTPESVTRNALRKVICALLVTALKRTWGMVAERGYKDENDYLLEYADFDTLDQIGELPSFGRAMGTVVWAREEPAGTAGDVSRVRFPNFVDYNYLQTDRRDRDERRREQGKERTAKCRARKRNAIGNAGESVTVTQSNAPIEKEKGKEIRKGKATAIAAAQEIDRGCGGKNGNAEISDVEKISPKHSKGASSAPARARAAKISPAEIPPAFLPTLDGLVGILGVDRDADKFRDQVGFLAQLAFADARGVELPKSIWDYAGRAKRKANPAGYLKEAIRDDLGAEGWEKFLAEQPTETECQFLLRQAGE